MPPALSITGLRKAYKDVVAVDSLDLEVQPGECFGLLGPNGAGKTTTVEICEGLIPADAGEVRLLGRTWREAGSDLRQRIGISLQETQFSEKLTVDETLRLFGSFYDRPRPVDAVLQAVQLGEKRRGRVGQLSGGQKQRLALACALIADPELYFLDEPTTGLDPQSRRQLWELIEGVKSEGKTVLLTTHYMEEAERLCDRVAVVDHGRVIALGTPRELVSRLGAQHVVEFRADDGRRTALTADDLGRLEGVISVRPRAEAWLLESAHAHRTIPALLGFLAARDVPIAELVTHRATLDDVFLHLTGRQLRDA
jgi:ABC-2 type transport system ATP-binding protein